MKFDQTGLEAYIPNRRLELEDGVWLRFPGDRAICIMRAGGSNAKFARLFQSLIRPYKRQLDAGTLDDETNDQVMHQVYAQAVVKDWEGIKDDKGKPVPYTPSRGEEFFEAFPEVFKEIVEQANKLSNFVENEIEEAKTVMGES